MRWKYHGQKRPPFADAPGPGQESVWDFPRPPVIAAEKRRITVSHGSLVVAESRRALRVLETASAPGVYVPIEDVRMNRLRPAAGSSICEWKGIARYFDLVLDDLTVSRVAWVYPDPTPAFEAIADFLSFYPRRIACCIDGEPVAPQPGEFYGGWVTADLAGPVKGGPGTAGW